MECKKVDVIKMPIYRFPFRETCEAFDLVSGYWEGVIKAMIDFN
jgi:hypothetical protein